MSLPSLMPGCTGTRVGRSCTRTQTAARLSPPDSIHGRWPAPVVRRLDALLGVKRSAAFGTFSTSSARAVSIVTAAVIPGFSFSSRLGTSMTVT